MAICLRNFTIAMLILLGSSSQAQEPLKVPVAIFAVTPAATTFVVARDRGYYREEAVSVSCEVNLTAAIVLAMSNASCAPIKAHEMKGH